MKNKKLNNSKLLNKKDKEYIKDEEEAKVYFTLSSLLKECFVFTNKKRIQEKYPEIFF